MSQRHLKETVDYHPPELVQVEALATLEQEVTKRARQLFPQSDIKHIRIVITSQSTDLGDVETHEGASYNHEQRLVTLRFKPLGKDGFYTASLSENSRSVTFFSFAEIVAARHNLTEAFPELLELMISRAVHEMLHGLTYQLWSFSLDEIKDVLLPPSTIAELRLHQALIDDIHNAYWTYDPEANPAQAYEQAYRQSLELLTRTLPFIKPEQRHMFVRTAYLHGLSEIVCVLLENKLRPSSKQTEIIPAYMGYYYVYQRLDLAHPTPKQHQELLQELSAITFPLDAESITTLTGFGDESHFETFCAESAMEI